MRCREGDVNVLLAASSVAEQCVNPRRRRRAGAFQAGRGLAHDARQHGNRLQQRVVLRILLALGVINHRVHEIEHRSEVRGPRELLDEREKIRQRPAHVPEVVLRHEQQRLAPQHPQIALVKNVREGIRLHLELPAQPFHELAVLLHVLALHHHHQVILRGKFFFVIEKQPVVGFVRADEVIPVRVDLQVEPRVNHAEAEEEKLRPQKQPAIPRDGSPPAPPAPAP